MTESSPRKSADSVAEVLKVKNSANDSILVARAREIFWKSSERKIGDDASHTYPNAKTNPQFKTHECTAKTPNIGKILRFFLAKKILNRMESRF